MSTAKLLKQATLAVRDNDLETALQISDDVLEDEPENTNALLIKGSCLQRQQKDEECVKILHQALTINYSLMPAWKGLLRSYQSLKQPQNYFDTAVDMLAFLADRPSSIRNEVIDEEAKSVCEKLQYFVRKSSSSSRTGASFTANAFTEVAQKVLALQIPPLKDTPVKLRKAYDLLSSISPSIIDPNALSELIYYRKRQFDQQLASISSRTKQVLGYQGAKVVKDRLAALKSSQLVVLLHLQIDTENDDEVRRAAESSLLKYLVNQLEFLSEIQPDSPEYEETLAQTRNLVDRTAMFEPISPLAWELAWDWDMPSLNSDDYVKKKSAIKRERRRAKRKGLRGNKAKASEEQKDANEASSPASSSSSDADEDIGVPLKDSDRKLPTTQVEPLTIQETVRKCAEIFPGTPLGKIASTFLKPDVNQDKAQRAYAGYKGPSVFAWLLIAQFYIKRASYGLAIDAVHSGLNAAKARTMLFKMDMQQAQLQLKMFLANAYTYYQAPKNIGLARELYDEVLAQQPENVDAMVGKGLILSQEGKNNDAITLLENVVDLHPDNQLALGELSWLFVQRGEYERGISGLQQCISISSPPARNAELEFKIGYTLWQQGNREGSFAHFVASLEYSKSYAPAFTYLGFFFEEVEQDKQRAQRCFYKALELDAGELLAGEKLATDFAKQKQWDLVEVVANTVLSSSKVKSSRGVDWPYRAMGFVHLNQLKYEEAVKYFQRCLRSRSNDVQAWVGLGEAYIHSGRYGSAEKALQRALKLEPENFSALYVLSLAQRETLDFPQSAESLKLAIKNTTVSHVGLNWALADNSIRAATYFVEESMLGNALLEMEQALGALSTCINDEPSGILWGSAAEVVLMLVKMGHGPQKDDADQLFSNIQSLITELVGKLPQECGISSNPTSASWLKDAAEAFALHYVSLSAKENKPRRVSAHAIAAKALEINGKCDQAIQHYQSSIQLEARNEDLWNSYGLVLQSRNPQVAQHCFIRALSLNGRNADTWVNLAGLYLVIEDPELALEAVDRALSLEPEHPRAWIAQALAESMLKSKPGEHIYRTLEFAYTLSSNDSLINFAFGLKEYEQRKSTPSPASLGALTKLLALNPNHDEANLVLGLLLERQGDYESSLQHLEQVAKHRPYAHIARVQLALRRYNEALRTCEQSNAASNDSVDSLSVLLTSGLAHFFLEDFDSAIERFTEALSSVTNDQEESVLKMLVEVLYSSQSAEARQVAQDQLFGSIDEHGPTLQVTMLLGAIGILENDEMVKEAAEQELQALITSDLDSESLAQACGILSMLDPQDTSFQRGVFSRPNEYSLWRNVDKQQALLVAEGQLTNPSQLSQALVEAKGLGNSQRAVFLDPLREEAWKSLSHEIALS